MNYRVMLTVLGSLSLSPLMAQTPIACAGQLVPLKPVALLSCPSAAAICLTDASGIRGHWVWGCPSASAPAAQIDPSIPLSVNQPHFTTPVETLMEIEKLRSLRLQNQEIEQQLRTAEQSTATNSAPQPDSAVSQKTAYSCGFLDGMLNAMSATSNTEGADAIREVLKHTACAQIRQYASSGANADNSPPHVEQTSGTGRGEPLVNADIIQMVKVGVKEDTILYMIDLRPARYFLGSQDRDNLRAAGVPDSVIKAMLDKVSGN
jgi:hypothetical protein